MNKVFINSPVAISRCKDYDYDTVRSIITSQFSSILKEDNIFKDKNVVLKPNLLMKATPDKAVTTHPVVLECVIDIIKEYSPRSITIAESPGGLYTASALGIIYRSTGIAAVAEKTGVILNYDTTSEIIHNPKGKVCKQFNIIKPIKDADVIVNLCKLKTHSLTTMSASVKNLFGTIPGIEKFEMHTRYKDLSVFEDMLSDLCIMHCERTTMLSVVDAVYGMEGNGPSGGDVRNYGLILSSLNPFNLDIACSAIMGLENEVGYVEYGKSKGVCVSSASELQLLCGNIADNKIGDLKLPETKSLPVLKKLPTMFGGKLNKFLEPRPDIMKNKCVGCGECMRSCPAKTIHVITLKNNKKLARIDRDNCIKCYCCQELCPINAVRIKKNPIFKIIK